ncbi:MAG: LCP family protein [Candidatus Curtissbacteria bacterium]|nr:LCP family protein [Candidatus Curtissbacteria bacterium]
MRKYSQKPQKSFSVVKILIIVTIVAALFFALIKYFDLGKYFFKGPQTVVQLITDSGLKSDNDRINVLLLGIGGVGHDGPDLTDTIILASVKKDGSDVALISIPRDLWVPDVSYKINHIYAIGQEDDENGLELAEENVSVLMGLPIHYAARVDFNGFIKAVNLVEGLDINVENSFVDPRYPIPGKEDDLCGLTIEEQEKDGVKEQVVKDATGAAIPLIDITDDGSPFVCRYETLSFKKGPTQMDGVTALKFVRSRHGTNGEGSDFARSARQQKVILAFREKVFSTGTLTNPKTIIDLIGTFDQSIDTNIKNEDVPLFVKLSQKIDPNKIRAIVLDAGREESVLEFGLPQNYGGQSVIIPKDANWTELSEYVQGEVFKLEEQEN